MRKPFSLIFFFLYPILSRFQTEPIGFLIRSCFQRPSSIFENKPCRNNTTASQLVITNIDDDQFSLSIGIPIVIMSYNFKWGLKILCIYVKLTVFVTV